jgi:Secretion system C-terminal sorting domain/Photosynthesis system II assembly factor YCF48
MKKLLLLLFLGFILNANSQNFWTENATSQPAAVTGMRSISIVDANISWLNMSCGTTGCATIRRWAKSINGGTSYTTGVIDLGAASANLAVANIHGVSADVAYGSVYPNAAGAVGGVFKTIDGGLTWAKQTTASFNDPASFANIVYFWDANNGVTMGDPAGGYFEIYTTTNGGTNWTRTPSASIPIPIDPLEYGLVNQFTVNGNTLWFGTTFGRVYKTTDKGLTWTVAQSPIPDFGGGINGDGSGDLAFTSETAGLLQNDTYELWSTSDAGTTWAPVTIETDTKLKNFGISEIPGLANTYVSVGIDLTNDPERGSAYSQDGGLTWIDINNNPDTNFVDGGVIAFLNSSTGFASGFSTSAAVGGIFKWNGLLPILATETFSNDKAFKATPNPTSGLVTISGKNIANVIITDVLGKQVAASNYASVENASIDMTSYNAGIYMVKVTNTDGNASTIKVVRQ